MMRLLTYDEHESNWRGRIGLEAENTKKVKGERLYMCSMKGIKLGIAVVALLGFIGNQDLFAHTCPSGATGTGVGVTITAFRVSNGQPVGGGSIGICECVVLQGTVNYVPKGSEGVINADFEGGDVTIRTPSGSFVALVTPAGGVPVIGPAECGGVAFVESLKTTPYCPADHPQDVDAFGNVEFDIVYGPAGTRAHIGANDILNRSSGTTAILVNVVNKPSCTITPASQSVCAGGSATFTANVTCPATASGGSCTVSWTGPNGFAATGLTITINNAQEANEGTYTATVTDNFGCTSSCTAQLIVNPNPSCVISPGAATTCVGSSRDFTVTVSSGTGPFTVVLSGCINETITGVTGSVTRSHACTAPGTCTLTANVTDANGCVSSPCTATHTCVPNPSCVISPGSATTCVGRSQDFTVTVSSGTGPFTVVLSGCINETITGVTGSVTRSHACTAPGTCTLTANVTDANGCKSSPCTATHICAPNPSCVISPGSATTCVGSSQDFTVTVSSGTGPFTVVLSGCINATITGVTGSVTRSHACTAPGTCTLTANVTDANGCKSSPCTATHICAPNPSCVISPGSATTCVGSSQDFTVTVSSGTGPFTVVLSGCINATITGVTG